MSWLMMSLGASVTHRNEDTLWWTAASPHPSSSCMCVVRLSDMKQWGTFLSVFITEEVMVFPFLPDVRTRVCCMLACAACHIMRMCGCLCERKLPMVLPSPPQYSLLGPQSLLLQDKLCIAVTSHYNIYRTIQGFCPLRPTDQTHTHAHTEGNTCTYGPYCMHAWHHTLYTILSLWFSCLCLGAKYQCVCTCDFSFSHVNLDDSHVTTHFHTFSRVTDVTCKLKSLKTICKKSLLN